MADDLAYMPAAELATLIRTRRLSPVELMTATLARIARAQPMLNAFITVAEEQALAGARAAEAAVMRGEPLAPLHGLPVSIKDLVPTAGIRTTWGSRVFAEHVPEADAEVVTRLKASGAIVVGKTTTPEFGQQCLTQAPLFGRTRNAWDAGRTSGGSSGGAAVAAAAGLTALGVATDGGGSTRIPAACNGVVGFKQGLGVVPQEYAQDGFGNISYVTPMTRTVRDTALMLDAMAGPDPRDPLSAGRLQPGFVATLDAVSPGTKSLAGLRVGWRPLLGNVHVAADALAACERAVAALADLGAETRGHAAPFENSETLWFVSNGAYRMAQFGHHLARHREILCPTFVRQMDRVRDVSAAELYAAIFARTALYRQVQAWFDNIDVLAMPTLSRTALPIDQDFFGPITIDGTPVPNLRAAWYPYTMPFNLTGNPAVSLPCGLDEAGVPVAIQLVGRVGEDARLLRVAAAFERAMPWADRRPPLPELD